MEPQVLLEEKEFIAVNKPAGVLVHQTRAGERIGAKKEGLILAEWVKERYPEVANVGDSPVDRPGVVHRLDRETSGVVIFARTKDFFDFLKDQFKSHTVKKTYIALVRGDLKDSKGRIDKPIGLKPGTTKRSVSAKTMKMVKDAVTNYEVIERFGEATLLRVTPETGRTHQIRVHLSSIGHPIIGDVLYGQKKDPYNLGRHFLHAAAIEFSTGAHRIMVEAGLPPELEGLLDALRRKR